MTVFDRLKEFPQAYFTYLLRKDLRKGHPVGDSRGVEAFLRWWDFKGEETYGKQRQGLCLIEQLNWERVDFGLDGEVKLLPRLLRDIWLTRTDLQNRNPRNSTNFVAKLERWYLQHCDREIVTQFPYNSELLDRNLLDWEGYSFISTSWEWFVRLHQAPQTYGVYLQRADLRGDLPLGDERGVEIFLRWWDRQGEAVYGKERQGLELMEEFNWQFVPIIRDGYVVELPRIWRDIWLSRSDLQTQFPLTSERFFADFQQWYLLQGVNELTSCTLFNSAIKDQFFAPVEASALSARGRAADFLQDGPGLSRYSFVLWKHSPDLQKAYDLNRQEDREQFQAWCFTQGCEEHRGMQALALHWQDYLCEAGNLINGISVPRFLRMIWRNDGALQEKFDLKTKEGVQSLQAWFLDVGHKNFPRLAEIVLDQNEPPERTFLLTAQSAKRAQAEWRGVKGGVNLIGNARSATGMGEVLRTLALALEGQSVPVRVIDVSTGKNTDQEDDRIHHLTGSELLYQTSVFCLSPKETVELYTTKRETFFEGCYCIGYWPWEYPKWPKDWLPIFDIVDEVWATSRFVYDCFQTATEKPLAVLHPAINVKSKDTKIQKAKSQKAKSGKAKRQSTKSGKAALRKSLRLPVRRFLYLFTFDFRSFLLRENPLAVLEAFQLAFSNLDDAVSLVIKVNGSDPKNLIWRAFRSLCAKDPRVLFIDRTLKRSEMLGLISSSDALLSLHRCEGVGLTMAEALELGTEVIATDYSASRDFLNEENSYPVACTLESTPANGQFDEGQLWATPDIEDAARRIKEAYGNRKEAPRSSLTFKNNQPSFSLERMGVRAVELLAPRLTQK